MANRATFEGPTRFYARSVDVTSRFASAGSGTPTLITAKSRGVLSVTRQAQGLYTLALGSKINSRNVSDGYAWTENVEVQPDVSCTTGSAPAAAGACSIYRDDVGSGLNLAPPTLASAADGGGSGSGLSGTTYYWRMTSVDAKGKESLASTERSSAITAGHNATLTYTPSPGAVRVRVYRGTATGAQTIVYDAAVSGPGSTTFTDTGAASQASATVDPPIQARPPIAAASVTIAFINNSGTLTDPASGEIARITLTFIDSTA